MVAQEGYQSVLVVKASVNQVYTKPESWSESLNFN